MDIRKLKVVHYTLAGAKKEFAFVGCTPPYRLEVCYYKNMDETDLVLHAEGDPNLGIVLSTWRGHEDSNYLLAKKVEIIGKQMTVFRTYTNLKLDR